MEGTAAHPRLGKGKCHAHPFLNKLPIDSELWEEERLPDPTALFVTVWEKEAVFIANRRRCEASSSSSYSRIPSSSLSSRTAKTGSWVPKHRSEHRKQGLDLTPEYAVPNALLIFPTYFGVFPSFHREFGDFPLNFDTFEAQYDVGIPLCFPLFLLPYFTFPQFFRFEKFPLNFFGSKNFPSTSTSL
jgi:hypothetical protein